MKKISVIILSALILALSFNSIKVQAGGQQEPESKTPRVLMSDPDPFRPQEEPEPEPPVPGEIQEEPEPEPPDPDDQEEPEPEPPVPQ